MWNVQVMFKQNKAQPHTSHQFKNLDDIKLLPGSDLVLSDLYFFWSMAHFLKEKVINFKKLKRWFRNLDNHTIECYPHGIKQLAETWEIAKIHRFHGWKFWSWKYYQLFICILNIWRIKILIHESIQFFGKGYFF